LSEVGWFNATANAAAYIYYYITASSALLSSTSSSTGAVDKSKIVRIGRVCRRIDVSDGVLGAGARERNRKKTEKRVRLCGRIIEWTRNESFSLFFFPFFSQGKKMETGRHFRLSLQLAAVKRWAKKENKKREWCAELERKQAEKRRKKKEKNDEDDDQEARGENKFFWTSSPHTLPYIYGHSSSFHLFVVSTSSTLLWWDAPTALCTVES
jgi:hypothetical protein